MRRVLFSIGRLEIYSYGFAVALALFLGLIWVGKAVEKRGVAKFDQVVDLAIQLFIGGLVGPGCFMSLPSTPIISKTPWLFLNSPMAAYRFLG